MTINEVGTTVLAIAGMTCGSCARTVERALWGVPGVQRATVELKKARALVEGSAPIADLLAAVEAAGYAAKPIGEAEADERRPSDEHHRSGCCG